MKALEKKQVLTQINSLKQQDLIELIESGDISIEEMIAEGLNENTVREIKNHYDSKKQKTIIESEAIVLCQKIENGDYSVEEIKDFLLSEKISESYLLSHTSLNEDLIDKIKNFEKRRTNFRSWQDLPPLEQNRTDLYFFGQPGSGKSCILASVFSFLKQNGLIINDAHNPIGNIYRNQLTDEIDLGILPDSTMRDGVNYIPIELRNHINESYKHPLNFIEMSGELFDDAYQTGINNDNLAAKQYLDNKNKKLIYFVLDYFKDKKGINSGGISQSSKMEHILSLLDHFGTLNSTDGVFIVLSKTDLFPEDVDRNQFAVDFLQKKYLQFYNNIKELQRKYKFEIKLYPYSIGEVKFQNMLTKFNQQSPLELIQDVLNYTFVSKKPWYQKIF